MLYLINQRKQATSITQSLVNFCLYRLSINKEVKASSSLIFLFQCKMQRLVVLFSFLIIQQIFSDNNNTNFHEIVLKKRDMKMLLLGQCEEVHKHQKNQNVYANFLNHPKNESSG